MSVEDVPGVYYFSRLHGKKVTPFYIGKSRHLRQRLKSHLASRRIADVLRGIKIPDAPDISSGTRQFHFAYLIFESSQNVEKSIGLAEEMMIRVATFDNVPLLNKNLTLIKTREIYFDAARGSNSYFKRHYEVEI